MALVETPETLQEILRIGAHRQPIQIEGNVGSKLRNLGVTRVWGFRRRLGTNGQKRPGQWGRFSWSAANRDKFQEGTERKNVATHTDPFRFAASLFGSHIAWRAHDGAMASYNGRLC